MAHDRAFRSNSFGISATIAFAFVMPNSRYFKNFQEVLISFNFCIISHIGMFWDKLCIYKRVVENEFSKFYGNGQLKQFVNR
ncbi:hypothetical protein LEP1GSC074_3897 [Leptospira noguchii str. Hook]|nr:hypothetical protein LEP1GSC041_1133 [Leptospira noguchii str. 2006001870]EMS82414.1 hypothetical protein LEP1GSC074_3897 [Leptospira noguchii str. Hook]